MPRAERRGPSPRDEQRVSALRGRSRGQARWLSSDARRRPSPRAQVAWNERAPSTRADPRRRGLWYARLSVARLRGAGDRALSRRSAAGRGDRLFDAEPTRGSSLAVSACICASRQAIALRLLPRRSVPRWRTPELSPASSTRSASCSRQKRRFERRQSFGPRFVTAKHTTGGDNPSVAAASKRAMGYQAYPSASRVEAEDSFRARLEADVAMLGEGRC